MRSLRPAVVAVVLALTVVVSGLVAACGSNSTGATPSDPVLATGQQVYKAHCQACHGTKGQGGTGMKLAGGRVAGDFPNINDQVNVIASGRGSMPAWKNSLSADEMLAVARYERECLGTTC